MVALRCSLYLVFFISLQFFGISTSSFTPEPVTARNRDNLVAFNRSGYEEVCHQSNYKITDVCSIDDRYVQDHGLQAVDSDFIESKIFSTEIVKMLSTTCPSGTVCNSVWDQFAVDSIKMFWRDSSKHQMCDLTPCLSAILKEDEKRKSCQNPDRQLGFRAFNLLCQLTKSAEADGDVMDCIDAAVELLQYNAADLRRNDSAAQTVCSCSSKSTNCELPGSCRDMVKKYFCLSQRCSIDTSSILKKFHDWAWYFKNEQALRKDFHLRSCNEEKIPYQDKSPFIVEVIQIYGGKQIAMAISIAVVIACCTLLLSCVIYKKYYRTRLTTRDRNEYTEMKDSI